MIYLSFPTRPKIPILQRLMSARLDTYAALGQRIAAIRSDILKQFRGTSPDPLSVQLEVSSNHLFEIEK